MRHCKVINMLVQGALAKLFMSSSCYPLAHGEKAETRWQATPWDPAPVTNETNLDMTSLQ